jgi:hypothetical protein
VEEFYGRGLGDLASGESAIYTRGEGGSGGIEEVEGSQCELHAGGCGYWVVDGWDLSRWDWSGSDDMTR